MKSPLLSFIKKNWPLLLSALVLSVLLFRNPFSDRTLIPNFEPFPDPFHYLVPPRCFLQGQGWQICREGRAGFAPSVPPLYGLTLLPLFVLFDDPRFFYFLNVLLTFISLGAFYGVSRKITTNQFILALVSILLITSYHFYWLPTLAMAENLLLPLFLVILYLLSAKKIQLAQITMISLLAGLLYGTKYASLPTMTAICLILGARIVTDHMQHKLQWQVTLKKIAASILPVGTLFLYFGGWRSLQALLPFFSQADTTAPTIQQTANSWFGIAYVQQNMPVYMQALRGEGTRFLWDFSPLVKPWMAALGWLGLGHGLTKKRTFWLASTILLSLILQIGIISTFYTNDTRYIYLLLPAILLGICFWFIWLQDVIRSFSVGKIKTSLALSVVAVLILASYGMQNLTRLKTQVAVNLRYAETPWGYIAIKEMDTFITTFTAQNPETKQPIIISPVVPHLVDFYATADFSLLPLDVYQDFKGHPVAVWGENDYSDFILLYTQKIQAGHPVFVAKYGIGNVESRHAAFSEIEKSFIITEVHDGCFDQCDIYQLSLKTEEQS
jgi:Na+-translocating ferredoxin:NAD+ oxidoreductase RnfA subunit